MLDLDDHTDHRQWTQQHLDAADLRIPNINIAPTPPQGEIENDCMDVNVRGPGTVQNKICFKAFKVEDGGKKTREEFF